MSFAQVYPAFAICLCSHEEEPRLEVTVKAEDQPACHTDPGAADPEEGPQESGSDGRKSETHGAEGISVEACCGTSATLAPAVHASISRSVEIRSPFDATPFAYSEHKSQGLARYDGNARPSEVGTFHAVDPPLYLFYVSLLI